MLVLGIETSTPVSSVAIGSEQGVVASMTLARGRGHEEFLVPAIRTLCEQSGVSPGQMAGIAVGLGPGLFTGMRVGIATGKGLAQALAVPMVGLPSLDLLAFGVRYTSRLICACIDARRGEVFSAFYRQVPGGVQRISDYHVEQPERLASELDYHGTDVLFVGNGALVYREILKRGRAEFGAVSHAFPSANALVELALPRFTREETDSLHELEPLYLRKADVTIGWETRGVMGIPPGATARPMGGSRDAGPAKGDR
ncbi:MAG TPA: tRNA (adenosine(37)-N6)-threonylcarbamoyltransferase complex dimerization subunit type 1 TsaB [Actinomycetota bacterium]